MSDGTTRRGVIFLGGSVLAGLVIAAAIALIWPEAVRRGTARADAPAAASAPEPPPSEQVAPATEPAADADTAVAGTAAASTPLLSFAPAVKASAPAVVSVYTQRTVTERVPGIGLDELFGGPLRPRYRERVQRGLGSGVIVDRDGHIVTNHHVIAGSDQVSVQLADGRTASAQVVGRDPDTDLAVLKISLPRLPVMALGRSDRVEVGDIVLAIGNPLGLSQTVTHGIVSATGRAQLGVATFENFIQTDAAINVGNSGGALVNLRGELVGINTAVLGKNLGAEGIGVAIPVDLVHGVMRELLQHGRVIRGWIGILPEDIAAPLAQQLNLPHGGVVIGNLYLDSPALKAGLTRGDMIEAIDGREVRSARDTLAQIASRKPGATLTITGMRGPRKFQIKVPVTEAPVISSPSDAGTPQG
ncbi:MAG: trypsin-like peptidase domain-containing protein [Steroidobacteraceae bacterium]